MGDSPLIIPNDSAGTGGGRKLPRSTTPDPEPCKVMVRAHTVAIFRRRPCRATRPRRNSPEPPRSYFFGQGSSEGDKNNKNITDPHNIKSRELRTQSQRLPSKPAVKNRLR
ncbi:hypothetical protein MTP99_006003 [Tenebrio molitor]|uniref:Uncharacterized protein n=1 Tax=Tenebrio molitor TaxID=7067 RepID=A0A8J6HPJ3_TENMO|nr:hypothetical protein GEV33_004754 [Tenebrio molitor]KAJ3617965.1 hypothetical protein MTP99_006003 [Tenebrio molitor]